MKCFLCFLCLLYYLLFLIFFFLFAFSLFIPFEILFPLFFNDKYFETYIEAIERTWKNYPIKDISLTRKSGYKEIILFDMKDIDMICECSHIEDFKLKYKGQCSDYQLEVGCNEYNPINKAS